MYLIDLKKKTTAYITISPSQKTSLAIKKRHYQGFLFLCNSQIQSTLTFALFTKALSIRNEKDKFTINPHSGNGNNE
jgi:hypothetical protein